VHDLGPATVAIDAQGNSVYETLRVRAQNRLPGILDELKRSRQAAQAHELSR